MQNKSYIDYINSLHNYNAQNPNSYGERNVNNAFFEEVMVEVGLSQFIKNSLEGQNPYALILTGHAGDGKTSIMYQVLSSFGIHFQPSEKITDYKLPSGRLCRCIKDFSEIADEDKKTVLSEALSMPEDGDFVFMVANTGPLINTFGELFDGQEGEQAKIDLIEAMDQNTGKITEIKGKKICVINVATVDNTYFAAEFLENLTKEKLWNKCLDCEKKEYCFIYRNQQLISGNFERVSEFLNMHYIWMTEHGRRLTIRSMTEQLAYMLTGGFSCEEMFRTDAHKYLFSNLFFGYVGTLMNPKAQNILAVKEAANCGYDGKRIRSDESFLVNQSFTTTFGKDMSDILVEAQRKNAYVSGWTQLLRRAYYFTNIETDPKVLEQNYEDIFSRQFHRFLKLRNGEITPMKMDAKLLCDALSMIYLGAMNDGQTIPITLSRESGISQNVQMITGEINKKNIKIIAQSTNDNMFHSSRNRYCLKIEINHQVLDSQITLPLLNYFEELKNGIISTNIDPQLSHGIESLKAEISEQIEAQEVVFEMILLKNTGPKTVELEISEDGFICET